ncbi:MAG: hypothetical protein J6O40_07465 [Ruminococcus sp.]|nr:hypothetical protein [Ruminococcus sp.]
MAFMLYNIDEAVDHKYVVMKTMSGQAKAGTLVHIMDTTEKSDGILVDYRNTKTGQNFIARFNTVKDFCKWARPDTFLARHYENFSKKEIMQYLKVSERTFASFCLPIIAVALVIIWVLALLVIGGAAGAVLGVVLSIVAVLGTLLFFKMSKEKTMLKMYSKVGVGINFK